MRRSVILAGLASTGVLLLAGCTATTLPEFEREQTAEDQIRDTEALRGIDAATTRYVGDVDGYRLYLARAEDADQLCLMQFRADDDSWWSNGCGSGLTVGVEFTNGVRVEAGDFAFTDDEDAEREQLSESVRVLRQD